MARTRGESVSRLFPLIARLRQIPDACPVVNGKLDLHWIFGDESQERMGLENLAVSSIFDPDERARKVSRDALKTCTLDTIRDIRVEMDGVYLTLKDPAESNTSQVYLCDVPREYREKKSYAFA